MASSAPPPLFLGPERLAAATIPQNIPEDCALDGCIREFNDRSVLTLRTEEAALDASRSQLAPIAHMCIATYAHVWLEAHKPVRDGPGPCRTGGLEPRELKRWHLQLRFIKEFWLSKQPQPLAPSVQRVADVLAGERALCDCEALRSFLDAFLHERRLPPYATPRVLPQHMQLWGEYFSCFDWQLGNNAEFDRTLRVVIDGIDGGPPVTVGQVLLSGFGSGQVASDTAAMQGIIACPFFSPDLHAKRASASMPQTLGVGDSILVHLWLAYHNPDAPPFCSLRVHPLKNAVRWRERVSKLPFVCNWQGQPFALDDDYDVDEG
jgi:hypothetical protein